MPIWKITHFKKGLPYSHKSKGHRPNIFRGSSYKKYLQTCLFFIWTIIGRTICSQKGCISVEITFWYTRTSFCRERGNLTSIAGETFKPYISQKKSKIVILVEIQNSIRASFTDSYSIVFMSYEITYHGPKMVPTASVQFQPLNV